MNIVKEIEFPRIVDGVAVLVTENLWSDGAVTYTLYGLTRELMQDEDFDHMPTDSEVRELF